MCGAGGGWCPGGLVAAGWRGPSSPSPHPRLPRDGDNTGPGAGFIAKRDEDDGLTIDESF